MNELDISNMSFEELYKKVGGEIVARNKVELEDMRLNPDKYIVRRPGGLDDYYYKMGLIQQVIDSWEKGFSKLEVA